eukprot:923623-Pyramimonas_sp.AAC.1
MRVLVEGAGGRRARGETVGGFEKTAALPEELKKYSGWACENFAMTSSGQRVRATGARAKWRRRVDSFSDAKCELQG